MASEHELEARAKKHHAAAAHKHQTRMLGAWHRQSHLSASLKCLHDTLNPCKGVFGKLAHRRRQDELLPVLDLLQGLQQFEGLCRDAQALIAAHAEVLVLQEGVELSGLQEEDPPQVYSVLCGSVTLLHGSASDTELQQLLQTARTEWAAEDAALAEAQAAQQLCSHAPAEAAGTPADHLTHPSTRADTSSSTAASCSATPVGGPGTDPSTPCCADRSCPYPCCEGTSRLGFSHPGVWQRVMAAVSQNSRQQLQSSMDARVGALTTAPSTHLLQQYTHDSHAALPLNLQPPGQSIPAAAAAAGMLAGLRLSDGPAAERESSLTLSVAKERHAFCVSKFTISSPSGDGLQLAYKPPSPCLAAAASPDGVAAVLVVSKPVYMEALRLHQEHHLASTLDTICRIPALRHAPLKELTRLAAHLKQSTYTQGQSILRQGQEVADIHFVLQGSVQLTYSAALTHAAARAAARCSLASSTQQGPSAAAAAAARFSAGGAADAAAGAGGARGSSAGRFSGLALALRLEQTCFDPPVVLATRGPGIVLGDDAVRDRRLAVGVVAAEDGVVTLRVSPQKFVATLDPLTLRLFSRLRQQQDGALQDAITAAAAASAAALDPSQQQPATDAHRLALLEDIYSSSTIPTTLSRPLPGAQGLDSQHKPAWRSLKGKAASPTHEPDSALSTARGQHPHPHQHSQHSGKQDPRLAAKCQIRQAKAKGTERRDPGQVLDADWEAQLPAGLKPQQCANLPQTVSVRQLVEMIKDVGEYRKLHFRATTASAAAITAYAATAAARAASASIAGCSGGTKSLLLAPAVAHPQVASAAAAAATAAAALAARSSAGGGGGGCSHTELLEDCCIAVLRVQFLQGQAPVSITVLSSVLDDVYSACGAVAYDEGLQVVRWGPGSFILLAPIDPGVPEAAGVECAADVLLTAAARLDGLMLRAEGGLPMVRLAAGLAHGSCFMDYEAGNFISAISGKGLTAAACLCELASAALAWTLPSLVTTCASQSVLLVSDGVAGVLQAGNSYSLQAAGGSHMLLTARAALPLAPSFGHSPSGRQHGPQTARHTLGPGRHTILGLGLGTGLPPVTPKTPSSRRRVGSFGGARAQMRRQIRRKFEAMASFLAGAGDLPPPPESMLTQPPPPAQTVLDRNSTASPSSGFGPSAGGSSFSSGRARTVGFAAATDVSVAGSGSSSNGRSNAGGGRGRPMLSISLDQAGGTGLEDGSAPASAIGSVRSSKRMTPSQLQSVGRGDHSSAGRLKWGGEDRNSSSSSMAAAVMEQPPAATTAGAPGGQQLSTKQALGARRSKQLTGQRASVVSSHAGARHSSTAGVGANAPRHSTSLQATPNVHGASGCGPALNASNSGGANHSSSGSSSSSSGTRLRQQVWQEVAAMRAAGAGAGAAGTASLPGTVTATLAAARSSAAQLSSSGGWGSHRHGSVSYWGEGSLMTATPPRPSSPLGMGLPSLSPTGSRPGSPLLQLGISAAGVEAAGGALGSKENAYSRGRGVGSLVSLSGGVLVSAPAGAQLGAAAARDVSSSIARAGSIPVEKAVCFITPRTQAAAAAAAAAGAAACSVTQVQRSSHVAAAAQSAALQRLHEGAAQHSVQLATGPAAHTAAPRQSSCSSTGGASSCMEDTSGAGGPSQQQQQQKVTEEQQRRLVHAACKALGSAAAAEAYAASLPEDTLVANFSASGLVQLPSLYGLSQLHTLTASFNKLAALTGLLPASEDAVAAAAAAAASEALEAFTQQLNAGGMRSTASSRPGTAGSVGGAAGGGCCSGGSQVDAVACILQQQQHRPSSPLASTQQKQQQHRPQSPIASTNVSRRGQAAYEAAYEQHVRQLLQLRVPSGVSSLPASLVQLQLAHNQLVVLPPELPAALPALTMLDVSHNRLQELPATLGALLDLKALFVGHNQLQQLPGSISRLQLLNTLHAEHNQLSQLPSGLLHLTTLASLHIQHNSMQQLPEGLLQLTGLTSLGLGFNKLQHQAGMPQGLLYVLSSLRQLDLSGNGLTDSAMQVAAAVPAANVLTLREGILIAGGGVVRMGSPDAGPATSSTELVPGSEPSRDATFITATSTSRPASAVNQAGAVAGRTQQPSRPATSPVVPSGAAAAVATGAALNPTRPLLPHLVTLDVSHNALQQLPQWLPGSLAWLSAGHNSITELPAALCARFGSSLVGLELHHNQLETLPVELKGLSKLQLLSLDCNPGLHPDVVEKGGGLSWAIKWHGDKKQAAATAAVKASQRHKHY